MKLIGVTPISSSKYYCNVCNSLCGIWGGQKFCENKKCNLFNQSLQNRNVTEIVTLYIKEQLKSILTRNISLLNEKELSQPYDIDSGAFYKKSMISLNELHRANNVTVYPTTLNIHTDDAPLVHTTKSSLWPCSASIVELPPQQKNAYRPRTHTEFIATAQAADIRVFGHKKAGSILGVKETSPLLEIFEYPKQIIVDYMHLSCLGHMSNLIQGWLLMLNSDTLSDINSILYSQKFAHNMSVKFNYPINACTDWKAKHFRVFILSIGLPLLLPHLPSIIAAHFALYSMCIKLLHCPKSDEEIGLADQIIHYYC
ncbi:unnamed protein product [Adineta ricciae]|uniref:Uncharacterized protein n=1 Tax=Adineta ricciae TaxID=249248 RepID=A0A816AQ40_ADIRI|nr:unnamed protein product [Adineta ricciae]CAF1600494.1 unnamed protein product [Adineta ricciae]